MRTYKCKNPGELGTNPDYAITFAWDKTHKKITQQYIEDGELVTRKLTHGDMSLGLGCAVAMDHLIQHWYRPGLLVFRVWFNKGV